MERTLGGNIDAESQACDVTEEFLAEFDKLAKIYECVLEFKGHETRDWGYWFRVSECGLEKFLETKRS